MCLHNKLRLIDEYLAEGNVDPNWEIMIREYRQMLLEREEAQVKAPKDPLCNKTANDPGFPFFSDATCKWNAVFRRNSKFK